MKLKYSIVALLVVLLSGAGYFFYQQNQERQQVSVWSFVPEHAVFVYEGENVPAAWKSMEEQSAGEIIKALPWFAKMQSYRLRLDSVTENLNALFEKRQVHASLHITENNNFDYLFYLPVQGVNDYSALKEVIDSFQKEENYRFSKRVFHDFEIQEFTNSQTGKRFSFFLYANYFVGSFTPFLVEDVIRQIDSKEKKGGFREQHQKIFSSSHMDHDQGNLYVNGSRLGAFLNLFLKTGSFSPSYPYSSKLDVAFNEDGILMNGYTAAEDGEVEPYLQSLLHEQPQELDVAHMVPLRTAYLKFFGFKNGSQWHKRLLDKKVVKGWPELAASFPSLQDFSSMLGQRIVHAGIPGAGDEDHHLLYVHTTNGEKAAAYLRQVAAQIEQAAGDSLFQEEFGNRLITQISYKEFPEALLGPAFSGFGECFYLRYNQYIIFSNSIQELKTMLLDIETENTWQKSVQTYKFLQKINQEVNYGLYVNTEKIWKEVVAGAEPEWKSYLEKWGPYLRQFSMVALQFSSLEEMLYTNFLLQANPQDVQDLRQLRFTILHETSLNAPVAGKPVLLRNNRQKTQHIFVQDTLHNLYSLDAQGDIIKRDSLTAPVIGEVFQVDSRSGSEPQHLVATKKALYLFGAPSSGLLPGYPVKMPENAQIEWANVIDYNGSKMYRILVAASSGDLYMFDLEGKNLEGWQPRETGGALSTAPGHIRVRGKDCIYAFRKSGMVHLFNRRGESYDGFPLNLKDSLLGGVFIQAASDFSNTLFTTITKGGELLSFNLNGKITRQAQLFKPEINSSFRLVQDNTGNGFLIVRQSANRLSLLDSKGNLLFEKDYLGAAKVLVQYFYFGADKELIAVTDPQEEFSYLYDREGNLLNYEPLNSCCPVSIQLQEESGNYHVYKGYGGKVSLLKGVE